MGANTRALINASISSNRPVKILDMVTAARADNPYPTPLKLGEMRTFAYYASTQKKLPYWDMFPLIFIVDFDLSSGTFSGLNLHYLPLDLRNLFFSKIQMLSNSFPHLTPDSRLKITYQLLSQSTRYAEFEPCYKNYLMRNLRSPIVKIDATEWEIAVRLPVINFMKANMSTVYSDSRNKVFQRRYR